MGHRRQNRYVFANIAPLDESSLARRYDAWQGWSKGQADNLSKDPIVQIEQCYGPIVLHCSCHTFLVDGDNQPHGELSGQTIVC